MEQEFWKQFIGSVARKLLTLVAGILIARLGMSQEIVNYLTTDATVAVVAGFILLALSIGWTYIKTRFNINFLNLAHKAKATTPMGEIKKEAKDQTPLNLTV